VGLAVAIPSLIAYSYLTKKVETMSAEMESLVADLLAKCYYHQTQHLAAQSMPRMESYAPGAALAGAFAAGRSRRHCRSRSRKFYPRQRRSRRSSSCRSSIFFAILLIFVIVTTTFKRVQPEVTIKLPESKSAVSSDSTQEPALLSITESEEIYLDERKVRRSRN